VLLDTNIVLRNAHEGDPLHQQVSEALARLVRNGDELCIADQIVYEFSVVATRPVPANGMGFTTEQAHAKVTAVIGAFTLLAGPPDQLSRWLTLCRTHAVAGRQAHDARLVALMLAHGVTHILTRNPSDFTRYSGITVLEPSNV
jgi:predicted nucleic acid-binding protein